MTFQLTQRIIKLLCGPQSFEQGEAYHAGRRVAFQNYDPESGSFTAAVHGKISYDVQVNIDSNSDVEATCTCPAYYSSFQYCKHIAAVLLSIHQTEHSGYSTVRPMLPGGNVNPGKAEESGQKKPLREYHFEGSEHFRPSSSPYEERDSRLAGELLGLFRDKPARPSATRLFDSRAQLDVEFICRPFAYSHNKYMFGIEMKIGSKRLYIVQKIRDFLERIERQDSVMFSKHFSYVPELHSFSPENDAVIRQIIRIYQHERMYRETLTSYPAHTNRSSGERIMPVPPSFWEDLYPLLTAIPSVKVIQEERTYEGIRLSDEGLPLRFEFDQAGSEGYQLDIQGLDELTVLESYGLVLTEGRLLKLPGERCKRLLELKTMLDSSHESRILISTQQMEPFMERVVPGLMKLGEVHIAEAVSDRIMKTALSARLYLDRIRDKLLAGLEFQYGDIVINPLETGGSQRGEGRILMRDGEKERQIMELMEQSAFAKSDSGYFMEDEDGEYEFLYHIVPQLEKLVDVFATSAVKVRIMAAPTPPKIRADIDERTDWLEFRFEMEGIPESEIRNLLKTLGEKRKYYRMPNGSLMPLESEEFQQIVRLINEVGIRLADIEGAQARVPAVRGLHLLDGHEQRSSLILGKSFRRLLENMRNPDNLEFPVPATLDTVLRDYQKYGYQWMKTLAHYHFGGILADDMGLGKTLQAIAFIVSVLPEARSQGLPILVVAPASLVYNWRNELGKFAPEVRAVIADGSPSERSRLLRRSSSAEVIITSYPLLRKDKELYAAEPFHTLIMDEAQAFKNHGTLTAQSVKSIEAKYRFALTGTPVENGLEELWSIFNAVFPALFPNRQAFNDLPRETIARRVRPFLLRRLKSDVLKELPEKIETVQASELLPEQKKLYAAYLAELQAETLKHLKEDDLQKHRIKILAGLTRLRQLCCHPALFVEGYTGSSAKFEQLLEIIDDCRSAGKRMLIFSQFTQMLSLIRRELGYQGVPHFYLDGQTPGAERVELCSRFNEGEGDLFLISLKAGGTGLNLTGADTVILYDLWWNPAVEQQAADRAHRIGQKNVVQVIRLVTEGTVEDKMYELQQRKKNLIEEVIQPGQESLSSLSEQDIREILNIEL
ncbi:SNF2 helicase associated domain-containing protein [Paenibacillus sp. YPG26]|uniref:DEAD/DEAH box helicase n=1 Tax=Paenibacillus sp. YPG26 TaxID=2878915 RepID=UPI00203D2A13|nr:SNF2 helicase associated domain-containing protein [Paenibacillus sp. YPG26]USB33586.1 DEAD/DEAH box helicase [Paenibacillus sp. YPG26]